MPTVSRKPVGVWATSQPLISRGKQSGLTDAHRGDGKRFVVRADEKLTAFLDLERVARDEVKPHPCAVFLELGSVVTVEPKWGLGGRMAIAPVHYHLSLPCVEQKRHNPSRKLLEYHR